MYRGQGGSHGRTSTWKGEGSGGRARDYGHGESRRRRSRSRERRRSRSRSSSRDNGGNRHRERRRQRNRDRDSSSSSSSSSSSHHSVERPTKPWSSKRTTSASNPTNTAKVDATDRSIENKYNFEYQPPSGIFEESELQSRYSSGVNMEAPAISRIDTLAGSSEIGINPTPGSMESPGSMECRHYNYGNSQAPVSGGISMKLQAPLKEQPGLSLPRVVAPISAKLPSFSRPTKLVSPMVPTLPSKSAKIASVFNIDDDDEPEEMPPECKMRMKNVGRDTPTSAGPNSFGKTKIGFCNVTHIAEKKLEGTLAPPKKK